MKDKVDRVILHCDMNSFFASVELLEHPELANKPVAVCGDPEGRHGIILAKNEPAKKCQVKTAETIWQARKKCPDLILLPAHHSKYKKYYQLLNEIYLRYTDMVEPFSIDESWLDVTASYDLFGDGKTIADDIRKTVKKELGLTLSVGVSYNKMFAKMGSEYKKPDATTVITRENYKDILWPQDVGEMFFVGRASAKKLNQIGIYTIGDLAMASKNTLVSLLGKQGAMIYDYANGLDDAPVVRFSEREKIKSVGNGITFKRDLKGDDDINTALVALCDKVASRLRKYQMKAYGIKVDIKDTEFNVFSKQTKLEVPTNIGDEIRKIAFGIIKASWSFGKPIRLITITAINLVDEDEAEQLSLFPESSVENRNKKESVERAMDSIRDKFGASAIKSARIINNDIGINIGDKMHTDKDDEVK